MKKEADFTPWEANDLSYSLIIIPQTPKTIVETVPQSETIIILNPDRSRRSLKKIKRYKSVIPRVYEKHSSGPSFPEPIKLQRTKVQLLIKPVNQNELIMRVPHQKFHLQHPIKHAMKLPKPFSLDQTEPKTYRQQDQQLQLLRRRVRNSSTDIGHLTMRSKLEKMNRYEEQVIKKCSLKSLQVYENDDKRRLGNIILSKQPQKQPKFQIKTDNMHLLDKILSKYE